MFKSISKLFTPAPLQFLFPDVAKAFDSLPLGVRRAIQGAAPRGMRMASITPMFDDGGDKGGSGIVKGKSDLCLLMVQFVPLAPAWDSKDQVTIDVTLAPATADIIRRNMGALSGGYRFACRDVYAAPVRVVTA